MKSREKEAASLAAWSSGSSAVFMIDMISVEKLLAPFCYFLGKDSLRHFPLEVLASNSKFQLYLYKTKKVKLKNFNRTVISWHLRKQIGVIACHMY